MNSLCLTPEYNPADNKHIINKWIVSDFVILSRNVAEAMNAFRFNEASSYLYQFSWGTFCDWYIEFTKPLLSGTDEAVKKEVRETTGWVLDQLLQLLNPFMPYITEELHAHLLGKVGGETDKDEWLQTKSWPVYKDSFIDIPAQEEMSWVVRLVSEIRSVRSDMNVPAAALIKMQLKGASNVNQERFKKYNDIIRRLSHY